MTDNVNTKRDKDILFIHALTGLHPGSGTALGAVDMPIQRERHTQWPIIPGSSIKGVLRDACREKAKENHKNSRGKANEEDENLIAAFGPAKIESGTDQSHAGAISFTDARILAFPVRSLKGVFAWVTCPAVLERFKRDLGIADIDTDAISWPSPQKNEAAFGTDLEVDGSVVLEEFDFVQQEGSDQELGAITKWISDSAIQNSFTKERIKTHLVVLHDDDFTHFVRHATEVVARVALNYETKTAKSGALFYQEFLPPETLFYSLTLATNSRREGDSSSADKVLAFVKECIPEVLQIGADETIGKGLCAVCFMKSTESLSKNAGEVTK